METNLERAAQEGGPRSLALANVVRLWWPLAGSWLLMSAELPAISAAIARLPDPEIHLAAYGGVVFPLALIIESPIIMLLSASVALCKDPASYRKVRRFMMATGAALSALHLLVAFTPLYYFVARQLIGAPEEIIEPAHLGLQLMVPWSWSIGYRRFNQGVLIRFGHSRTVAVGTAIRLGANVIVLIGGYLLHSLPGIAVATIAVIAGVVSEAAYTGFRVQPVVRYELAVAEPVSPSLTLRTFLVFYTPLVLTSLLLFLAQPLSSAAVSRMPEALTSLATLSVLNGLIFVLRASGVALNEVVVASLDEPGARTVLRRFAGMLATGTTLVLVLVAATPLAWFWFRQVSGVGAEIATAASAGLWLALPLPALAVLQSLYQGAILHSRRTNGITESVVIYLGVIGFTLWAGVLWGRAPGLLVAVTAMTAATVAQVAWLWYRSRSAVSGF